VLDPDAMHVHRESFVAEHAAVLESLGR
jgi:hypothetical protein